MAPLPENSTDRFWLDYTDGINDHSLLVRFNGEFATVNAVMGSVQGFLEALSPELYTLTIQGARVSAQGSNISVPVPWSGNVTYGQFAMPNELSPRQLCFLGRDGFGRRARWFVFGWDAPPPDPFRIGITPATAFDNALIAIRDGQQESIWLTIAGQVPTMYTYVDVNYNSYYEAKAR